MRDQLPEASESHLVCLGEKTFYNATRLADAFDSNCPGTKQFESLICVRVHRTLACGLAGVPQEISFSH
jgi:hypothetical protein